MSIYPANQKILLRWIFMVISIVVAGFLFKNTLRFWDMLPYMGSVVSIDNNDPTYVHTVTYLEFNRYATPEMKTSMIEGHSFCKNLSQSPAKFNEQLPFFKIKMLFVYLAWMFYQLGIPLFYAVLIPSVLAFVGIALISYQWINQHYKPVYTILLSLATLLFLVNFDAFRIASPDALASFFMIAGSYFFMEKKKIIAGVILLSLSVITRPDYLIFVGLFLLLSAFFNSGNNRKQLFACFGGVMLVSLFFMLTKWQSGGYDAYRMFYRSFIYLEENPYTANIQFNMDQYMLGIRNGLNASWHNKGIYLIPLLLIALYAMKRSRLQRIENIWIIAAIGSFIMRIFLHPLFETRYLMGFIIVLMLLNITAIRSIRRTNKIDSTNSDGVRHSSES